MKSARFIAVILILVLLATTVAGCVSKSSVSSGLVANYIAVAPLTMHAGESAAVAFTLLGSEGELTRDKVKVSLMKDGNSIVSEDGQINGKGQIEFDIPLSAPEGSYELQIKGSDFEDKTTVTVEKSLLVFVETDKPIYKPGQTMHIRAITLNSDLRPVNETVIVEILDAKGIKIFRKEVDTDKYGMASFDLPISSEPNLGTWKINASAAESDTQLDVRIEEYVLPKYEVSVELPKEWYLADEAIEGIIKAEYSFGKPVKGKLEITATRYVGQWEEYATFAREIDGQTEFEIPAVGYVAGVPEARGMGNIILDITVIEQSTGYQESTSRMFTVAESPLSIQLIPEGTTFKPGLPFEFLIVTETPDNQPTDAEVQLDIIYIDDEFAQIKTESKTVKTANGMYILSLNPPEGATALQIDAFELTPISSRQPARASMAIEAAYSPSGNFIHVAQTSEGITPVGQEVIFKVHSTSEAANFYYEVVSRNKVVFTSFTRDSEIDFQVTPQMAPSAKLLVYQILPSSEVAADYIPFSVEADYPNKVEASFSVEQAGPGDEIEIEITSEGQSKVGIAAVDKSVFILAENRLNLQQVFDALEQLYMEPQAELHEVSIYGDILVRGAQEIFEDAGLAVMSNQDLPEGKEYENPQRMWEEGDMIKGGIVNLHGGMGMPVPTPAPGYNEPSGAAGEGLAEVERVRQYFPETWLWQEMVTDSSGKVAVNVEVPDTITTWMLRAVAISEDNGLGIGEAQLVTFQPFFLKIDLPYSSIRGEEFPVKVAVYNYLDETQEVFVTIEDADWFELRDDSVKSVEIGPNEIGGVEFKISPRTIGIQEIKITAQSTETADAAIKTIIVEPEGVARENVENLTLSDGSSQTVDTTIPATAVADSGRAYVAVTSSFLTQTLDGLEQLLQMPFGCGEQNMMNFTPDVFITKYLEESGQLKPEIMAKAEKMMITGYQRELTYRHRDGSFSAFGESDETGSLWLTAFVLKSFAQAKDVMYIDQTILDEAENWIVSYQKDDGSFESVGFICHQEILGGLQGKDALTAFVAIALTEAGESTAAAKAVDYLEGQIDDMNDAYTVAITAYAMEMAGSDLADDAYDQLMALAEEDENGLHWGGGVEPLKEEIGEGFGWRGMPQNSSAVVETTAYATLALIEHGDAFNASRAAKWLVSQRNAYGGYGSTQDTVVALQALTEYSTDARADVDLNVTITAGEEEHDLIITQENFDVLQIVQVPVNGEVTIGVEGEGEAIAQVVTRYNMPEVDIVANPILTVEVDYDATEVEVNDIVEVSATVKFNPPMEMEAGMTVVDIPYIR